MTTGDMSHEPRMSHPDCKVMNARAYGIIAFTLCVRAIDQINIEDGESILCQLAACQESVRGGLFLLSLHVSVDDWLGERIRPLPLTYETFRIVICHYMHRYPLEDELEKKLEKRYQVSRLRSLKTSPSTSVDLSSNDFLSLASSVSYKRDFEHELAKLHQIGSKGSRLLDGNSELAESLELEMSKTHGSEDALLVNSGYDANVSIFSCIPQPGDVIIYDKLIHASVHDGMRRSRAKHMIPFEHNSIQDLEKKLKMFSNRGTEYNIFVAVEGVYSMEGDLAPLSDIVRTLRKLFPRKENGYLIVDEAHSFGIYGPRGRGRVNELGLEAEVFIRLNTFGKSLGCMGAAILCSRTTKSYLINYARPVIYSTFMSFPHLVAIQTAYRHLQMPESDILRSKLRALVKFFHEELITLRDVRLQRHGFSKATLDVSDECPESPVFALFTKTPRQLASVCQEAGFVVRPIVPPTVPSGTERVRVCLHASNTKKELIGFIEVLEKWALEQSRPRVAKM